MKIKKIASLTALLAFIVILLTSFILYIVPQGRVANWANWRLWGLSKTQWGAIHINTGILFLIALGFHIYYNWKPIVSYLKDKAKNLKIFTKEFNMALIMVLAFVLGTYAEVPPFSSILGLSESIKDTAAEKYGEPPYGRAELSTLKTFTKKMGVELKESMTRLKEAGYVVRDEKQTLAEIGVSNKITPQQVYLAMKPSAGKSSSEKKNTRADGAKGGMGLGQLTLAEFCSNSSIPIEVALQKLSAIGIKAKPEDKMRKIAKNHKTTPFDLVESIKQGG